MNKLIDHEKAKGAFYAFSKENIETWILVSGGEQAGKTTFLKHVSATNTNTLLCVPKANCQNYAELLVESIFNSEPDLLVSIIIDFLSQNHEYFSGILHMGYNYPTEISIDDTPMVFRNLIKQDISNECFRFSHYLANKFSSKYTYILFDDFHLCNFNEYKWIIEFWNNIDKNITRFVAVCNFKSKWNSELLYSIFKKVTTKVSVDNFDSYEAYCEVIKDFIFFENNTYLTQLSQKLFNIFKGNVAFLYETLQLYGDKQYISDSKQYNDILSIAQGINCKNFGGINQIESIILSVLSFVPIPITSKTLSKFLDINFETVLNILNELYNKNLIEITADLLTGDTLYHIRDTLLKNIFIDVCTQTQMKYIKTKIFRLIQAQEIRVNTKIKLDYAIEIKHPLSTKIFTLYLEENRNNISCEEKAKYINKLINITSKEILEFFNVEYANLLYEYGYYMSANKIMSSLPKDKLNFTELMLLGDIQHVLLSPDASKTYEAATKVASSASDSLGYLRALSRQVMALNQEHHADRAKKICDTIFKNVNSLPSIGLVEFYRNANNNYAYKDAIELTVKGYLIAKQFHDELEAIKCLHNICMIKLQNGTYSQPLNNHDLNFEPSFENVLTFFSNNPKYYHERVYPLLDLGTEKVFEYVKTKDTSLLMNAKNYYSEAQLYAKSFYSQHIASVGLLIVNSHLYKTKSPNSVKETRKTIYQDYRSNKNLISDHRVHKKMLLSLATSALLTQDNEEAKQYLHESSPYVNDYEVLRYNNLCIKAGCNHEKKSPIKLNGRNEIYYGSDEFVPWVISLCH